MSSMGRNKSSVNLDTGNSRPNPSVRGAGSGSHLIFLGPSRVQSKKESKKDKDRVRIHDSEPPPSRSSTPRLERSDFIRRSSAPSPANHSRAKKSFDGPASGRGSPKIDQGWSDSNSSKKGGFSKRRDLSIHDKHIDHVLHSPRRPSSPSFLDATTPLGISSRFTYAQALGVQPRPKTITITPYKDSRPIYNVGQTRPQPFRLGESLPLLERVPTGDSALSETDDHVFDSDQESLAVDIASVTDLSSSTWSDRDLPSDIDRDDPLLRPEAYYSELNLLEANVAGRSGVSLIMKKSNRQNYPTGAFELKVNFHSHAHDVLAKDYVNYDLPVIKFCKKESTFSSTRYDESDPTSKLAYFAFHLLECRNLMLAVIANVEDLRRNQYCNQTINYLTLDPAREMVAHLTAVAVEDIRRFSTSLEEALQCIMETIQSGAKAWSTELASAIENVTSASSHLLLDWPAPWPGKPAIVKWRLASILVDLSVVSYSGAHLERFDLKDVSEDLDGAKITAAWTYDTGIGKSVILRRRTFKCLNDFLGGSTVWVFQPQSIYLDDQELYLSADIIQLADIWGPIWAVNDASSSTVLRYNAGPGSIVSWPNSPGMPGLAEGEIHCHWLPLGEKIPKDCIGDSKQRLLIGSPTIIEQKTSQLKENEQCQNKTRKVIRQLKAQNLLEELGTRASFSELAEQSFQVGIGFEGVQLNGSRVYKRRAGVSLKDAICDAWRSRAGNRNPAILEEYLGVEISFCSHNARRRRLKSIFNSTTMRNWLEGCKTNAEPFPCEKAFNEAIASEDDPYAFRNLWKKHREWREDLEQLVSWCLEGLRYSCFDPDGTLRAVWLPHDDTRYRVKIKTNPHSWSNFLADTRETCAFMIVSGRCLQTDYEDAAVCQTRLHPKSANFGWAVLETALAINPQCVPECLRLAKLSPHSGSKPPFRLSRVRKHDRFPLAKGWLRVIETFAKTRLLVDFEGGVVDKMILSSQRFVARALKDEPLYHRELKNDEDTETKPIPIFVVSQYEMRRS